MGMNNCVLVGRLVSEVEVINEGDEKRAVLKSNSLAIDRVNKTQKFTDFIPIAVFGRNAINVGKYCNKGDLLGVQGSIQCHTYEDNSGVKRTKYEVVAEKISFFGSRNQVEENEKTIVPANLPNLENTNISGDDLPF